MFRNFRPVTLLCWGLCIAVIFGIGGACSPEHYKAQADEEVYKGTAIIVANSMQKAWFEACRTGIDLKIRDLPMPVDVFVGYNWGRIEDDYIHKHQLTGMENYAKV